MISREIYFNVPLWAVYLVYVLTAIAILLYGRAIYRITGQWIRHKKDQITDKSQAVRKFFLYGFAQKSVFTDRSAGIMHTLVFIGFSGLFAITLLTMLEADTPLHFLEGGYYVVFSLLADVFGIMLLLGLLFALWRRMYHRPQYLSNAAMDLVLLLLLIGITLSGFFLEGLRIALSGHWEFWSPIGSATSFLFAQASAQTLGSFHFAVWFAHLILAFGLIFLIPYTKLAHVLAAFLNIPISNIPGTLKSLPALSDIARRDRLGTGSIQDLTGKSLLEIYACTSCGRCEENCPVPLTGKELSPKRIVQALRSAQNRSAASGLEGINVWNCTTCGFCTWKCPVSINHQSIIWNLRTYTTTGGRLPFAGAKALENIEYLGDPWGTTPQLRSETRGKLVERKKPISASPDYLYWTGCSIYNDPGYREIASSLVRLLNKAGVNFEIMDGGTICCGDPARRLGEEGLFQKIVTANRSLFRKYAGATILTHCPHCFHTLKNEYALPELQIEVRHHSEVILTLLEQGRITIPHHVKRRVVYHDPCYLGRHNHLYEPARTIIGSFNEFDCSETIRNRANALCCGGGGGQMWLEAQAGEQANYLRLEEIQQREPDLIVTACPYCNIMLENAISFKGLSQLEIKDIGELFG